LFSPDNDPVQQFFRIRWLSQIWWMHQWLLCANTPQISSHGRNIFELTHTLTPWLLHGGFGVHM
jgi:hypothetical protein